MLHVVTTPLTHPLPAFARWLVTVLLVVLLSFTAQKTLVKGVAMWRRCSSIA